VRNNMRNSNGIRSKQIISGSYASIWQVAKDGYKLLDASTHKCYELSVEGIKEVQGVDGYSPWLVPQGNMLRQYPPLSKPTLHREFAHLHSEESIVRFANRYGLLGQYVVQLAPIGGGTVDFGESLNRWRQESGDIGALLCIWDLVKLEAAGKLVQLIKWVSNHTVYIEMQRKYDEPKKEWQVYSVSLKDGLKPGILSAIIANDHFHPELLERWQRGDVVEPAKYYVCREINERLKGHVTPQVLPFVEDKIYLFPDSLLSSLWVMFLLEITGNVKVRRCDICGKWKEQNLIRHNFYCSSACRQEAYRRRQQKKEAHNERSHTSKG
jgi:hypothetical protein